MLLSILKTLERLGHVVFIKGDYNLNIVMVRTPQRVAGVFDDWLYVVYMVGGEWVVQRWSVTTDPGVYWLHNPMRVSGTAIRKEGQSRGSHAIGDHRRDSPDRYEAMVQVRPVAAYRDNNRDAKLDFDPASVEVGLFGLNIHRAGSNSNKVDKWSAGCCVFQKRRDFEEGFMPLVRGSRDRYGNSFTTTLIKQEDLKS